MSGAKAWLTPIQRLVDTLPANYERQEIEAAFCSFLESQYEFDGLCATLDHAVASRQTRGEVRPRIMLQEQRRKQLLIIAARALKLWDALEEEKA